MNSNNSQLKHALIYGSVTGGMIIVYLLILFVFSMMNNSKLINISALFYLVGGYISVRHYRDRVMGGYLNFGKAYGTAFLTFLFAGITWGIYGYILYKYLSPGLMEEKITQTQEALLQLGWSEDRIEAYMELAGKSQTPFTYAFGYIFNAAFWGALIALAVGGILRRSENPLLKENE